MAENKRKKHYLYMNYINKGSYIVGITKKGEEFYFDSEDFDEVRKYNWWFNKSGYPITKDKNHKDLFLHHLVMGEKNKTIDHINRKRNDARKSNLRYATRSQNCSNINLRKDNTSKIIGVSRLRGKWQANIQYKHKKYYLGVYNNFEDAVRARLKAEQRLLQEFAPQQHLFNKYNIGGEDIEIQ